jgi:hypothetical protein
MNNIIQFPKQAKTNSRSNNYLLTRDRVRRSPVTRRTIYPYLISRAAADERRRARHKQRVDAYILLRLLHFAGVVTKRVSELRAMTPRQVYDVAFKSKPEPKGYVQPDLRACYRLQNIRRFHQSYLSQEATDTITYALCWYSDLCEEMKEKRERGAPSLYELIYAHNTAVDEALAKKQSRR